MKPYHNWEEGVKYFPSIVCGTFLLRKDFP